MHGGRRRRPNGVFTTNICVMIYFTWLYLQVMIYLVDHVLPESYFDNNLRALSVDMAVFRDLLRMTLPTLSRHLDHLQQAAQDVNTGGYHRSQQVAQDVNTGRYHRSQQAAQNVNTGRYHRSQQVAQDVNTGRYHRSQQVAQDVNTGGYHRSQQVTQDVNR